MTRLESRKPTNKEPEDVLRVGPWLKEKRGCIRALFVMNVIIIIISSSSSSISISSIVVVVVVETQMRGDE